MDSLSPGKPLIWHSQDLSGAVGAMGWWYCQPLFPPSWAPLWGSLKRLWAKFKLLVAQTSTTKAKQVVSSPACKQEGTGTPPSQDSVAWLGLFSFGLESPSSSQIARILTQTIKFLEKRSVVWIPPFPWVSWKLIKESLTKEGRKGRKLCNKCLEKLRICTQWRNSRKEVQPCFYSWDISSLCQPTSFALSPYFPSSVLFKCSNILPPMFWGPSPFKSRIGGRPHSIIIIIVVVVVT